MPRIVRACSTRSVGDDQRATIAEAFSLGREQIAIPGTGGLRIGIYSPERCLADAYRLRGELGYETTTQALRTWLNRGGKPADLIEMATLLPRARTPLLHELNALT